MPDQGDFDEAAWEAAQTGTEQRAGVRVCICKPGERDTDPACPFHATESHLRRRCTCPSDCDAAGRDRIDHLCPIHGTHVAVPRRPETPDPSDAVNHPAHYGGADNPYEAIKVIEAWDLGFCLGNAVKYIARAGKKGDLLEDLWKAAWYVNRAIKQEEQRRDAAG